MKKILGILVCMLLIALIYSATGFKTGNSNISEEKSLSNSKVGLLRSWDPEHILSIHIDKLYVYDSGDRNVNDPAEYFFKLFAFPKMWHFTTDIFEVDDEQPDVPYNLGKLGAFKTKFTPQWILVLALEDDKDEGIANFNEFLDWKLIKFNPPKGDYPLENEYMEIVEPQWENHYFKAVTKIYFHYE